MATVVTLNVFSGRPNPSWQLTPQQEQQFTDRLMSLETLSNTRPTGLVGQLGYRGFSVTRNADHPLGALGLRVHERIVDSGPTQANLVDNAQIEAWLLETSAAAINDDVRQYVASSMERRSEALMSLNVAAAACPSNHAADAPAYNPAIWNTPTIQPYNNCYNYANNNATNTFAQPGRATGHQATAMACSHVTPAAQSDGLRSVSDFSGTLPAGSGWYVALVVWPNNDYHWYRQDAVGCWSHKPGQTAARNTDNANHTISDPRTCDRGPYTNFCTFMVTNRGVHIR